MEEHSMKSAWETKTYTFKWLRENTDDAPCMSFLWLVKLGVIPQGTKWKRSNRIVNTNLKPDAIPAGYLAEVAYEWDSWGGGASSRQFMDALAFEVNGTEQKSVASEMMTIA
jgi:hypothetical protein